MPKTSDNKTFAYNAAVEASTRNAVGFFIESIEEDEDVAIGHRPLAEQPVLAGQRLAGLGIFMDAVKMRLIPEACLPELCRPIMALAKLRRTIWRRVSLLVRLAAKARPSSMMPPLPELTLV